ncbi:hypothetical protein AX17_004302 [Amanita inopinata Kibby_2008]|nr:hypothetical protein AX17_004302 [Amanita inopinata Kibby_2008]
MRTFGTLSLITALSGALFASAVPLAARGVADANIVNAVAGAATTIESTVSANNILNHQVTQTQSDRRGVDADSLNNHAAVAKTVLSSVHTEDAVNQKLTQRDVVDVDGVKAIVDVITGVPSNVGLNNIGNSGVHQSTRRDGNVVNTGDVKASPENEVNAANVANQLLRDRGEQRTLPVIILEACARLVPISNRINTLIAGNIEVKVDLIVPILEEIKAILTTTTADIKFLISHPIQGALVFEGRVLTTVEFGHIVASFIYLVFTSLTVAVYAVGNAKVYVIAPVLGQIGVLVAGILASVFALVGGLLEVVTPLIQDIVPTILGFKFAEVCAVLKLVH